MHTRPIRHSLAVIAVIAILAACDSGKPLDTSSVSQPLALPADTSALPDSGASPAGASVSPATTRIPEATSEIWRSLDKQSYELQKAVDGGKWKQTQTHADAIRDLTAALPARATKLSTDDQTRLQLKVTQVATYLQRLDTAAASGDAVAAKGYYKKASDTLGGITRFP